MHHVRPHSIALTLLACAVSPPTADGAAPPAPGRALVAAFFPEGPCVVGRTLLYIDYTANAVMAWDGVDAKRVWHRDGSGPSAILPMKDGTLLIACNDHNAVVRIDPAGKKAETRILPPKGQTFNGPNDFAADRDGGVYFSTSGKWEKGAPVEGRVYYLSPKGKVTCVARGIHYANGLAVVDGGKRLLVAEGMKNQVLQYPIGEGGALGRRSVWKRLADIEPDPEGADWFLGPDGLKADAKGNVYICQFGAGRILVTDKAGRPLRTIRAPRGFLGVTNISFNFKPGENTLYVTAVRGADEPYLGAVFELPNR